MTLSVFDLTGSAADRRAQAADLGIGRLIYAPPAGVADDLAPFINRGFQDPRRPFRLLRDTAGDGLLGLQIVERGVPGGAAIENRRFIGTLDQLQAVMRQFLSERGILQRGVRPGDATPDDFQPVTSSGSPAVGLAVAAIAAALLLGGRR